MSGLSDFSRDLLSVAQRQYPRESKKFLKVEGRKVIKNAKKIAKQKVKKGTGNYLKGFKVGRPYLFNGDALSVRAYNSSPHAHLIERGHKNKDGGFTVGQWVAQQAGDDFLQKFERDCETFVGDLIEKGLGLI